MKKKQTIINLIIGLLFAGCLAFALLGITGNADGLFSFALRTAHVTVLMGEGTQENPYRIYTPDDLYAVFKQVNTGVSDFEGKTVRLERDLKLFLKYRRMSCGGVDGGNLFRGTFDGNGHMISGINISNPEGEAGLFHDFPGTVKNLQVQGSVSGETAGGIAARVTTEGKIINCLSQVTVDGNKAGGIAGNLEGIVENCVSINSEPVGEYDEDSASGMDVYKLDGDEYVGDNYQPEGVEKLFEKVSVDTISDYMTGEISMIKTVGEYNVWGYFQDELTLLNKRISNTDEFCLTAKVNGEKVKFKAFYSEVNREYAFMLPAYAKYSEDDGFTLEAKSEGKTIRTVIDEEDMVQAGELTYPIKVYYSDSIPSLYVDTHIDNALSFINDDKNNTVSGDLELLSKSGDNIYSGKIRELNGRGNDSFKADKKGYSLKLEEEADLFNMGSASGYNLLPGYRDNSVMTYLIHRDLYREIGLQFTHSYQLVDYYLDGKYMGVYFLTEKMEIAPERFDISDSYEETKKVNELPLDEYECIKVEGETLAESHNNDDNIRVFYDIPNNPEDITGGYLYELNSTDYDEEESRFVTNHGATFTIRSNYYASKEQIDYSSALWQDLEDAIFAEDGINSKGRHYSEYLDLESMADQWILYELGMETSMCGSVYYYKESDTIGDGKLHAVWIWDSEHSFIVDKKRDPIEPWIDENNKALWRLDRDNCRFWYELYSHPEFRQMVNDEWINKFLPALKKLSRDGICDNSQGLGSFDFYRNEYAGASRVNHIRWASCDFNKKIDTIEEILEVRVPFLTKYFQENAK